MHDERFVHLVQACCARAGTDAPNVASLVYIAAFRLDHGESLGGLLAQGPVTPALAHLVTDQGEDAAVLVLVAADGEALPADAKRQFAGRMGAATVEIRSSHVAVVSRPGEVARLIETAAEAVLARR